ncbi:MAG: PAS domain-containing sensor histidine kinase, partial [Ignavibacteriaceae bacterium]|nr:PAS domain-containing sensor histidine kinase [Ignavibacteriaceae bacterium]
NGIGISKEDLPRIFEPFYSTKGQKGTGLGLAVIWGIIDNHDGTINVESEIGKGTTFSILLPIKQSA